MDRCLKTSAPPRRKKPALPAGESVLGGGFEYEDSVAADRETGAVYVADGGHNRVEEFTGEGKFVLTFGWNVNETKVIERDGGKGVTQQEANVCTAASDDICGAGEVGTGASEQLAYPDDIAVEPSSHNVYVAEVGNNRIDEYTPAGRLVLMIGGNVNKTMVEKGGASEAERNVCVPSEDECQAGELAPTALTVSLEGGSGNLLAVGPQNLLYVGDGGRVLEFEPGGKYKGEVSLDAAGAGSEVATLALAVGEGGELYVAYHVRVAGAYQDGNIVRQYDSGGTEMSKCILPGEVQALALDPPGRFVVGELPLLGLQQGEVSRGAVYSVSCEELSTFAPPGGFAHIGGLAFAGGESEHLYVADYRTQQILRSDVETYAPVPIAEVRTGAAACSAGPEYGSSATEACVLAGEANPEGVAGTTFWFQYGRSETLGLSTAHEALAGGNALVSVDASVEGLAPNETYYYRSAAEDENTNGEPVHGKQLSFATPPVAPAVTCGEPEAFDVTFFSATLSCGLNPENAETTYRFQYGPCASLEGCVGLQETAALESSAYGDLGATQTTGELAPATTYRYRLLAVNEHGQATAGQEGSFTTPSAPHPTVVSGVVSGIGATSATLSGIVNPDGAGAIYTFQVGLYNGSSTVYSTVAAGATSAVAGPETEEFMVTGLQPGRTYAYEVTIKSSYTQLGEAVAGAPVLFTTAGLPTVLFAPTTVTLLPVPNIVLPTMKQALKGKNTKIKKAKHRSRKGKRKNAMGRMVKKDALRSIGPRKPKLIKGRK